MPHYHITHTGIGPSRIIQLDLKKFFGWINATAFVAINGTMTVTLEATGDDCQGPQYESNSGNWIPLQALINSNSFKTIDFPTSAVRINVTAYTSGSATLSIVQAEG
jgi:hypothetical protein